MNIKMIGTFLLGMVVGAAACVLVLNKLENVDDLYEEVEHDAFIDGVVEESRNVRVARGESATLEEIKKYYKHDEKDSDHKAPYLIDMEEMDALDDDTLEMVTLIWYKECGTLAHDENDEVVDDPYDLIGDEAVSLLRDTAANMLYVRNEKLSIDFEILGENRSYQEVVLDDPAIS